MVHGKKRHLRVLTSTASSSTILKEVRVVAAKFAQKQIDKLPESIRKQMSSWRWLLESSGINAVRKISGYHDEPLKGKRFGQRSVRLSRSWRLIYEEHEFDNQTYITVIVLEVNKHEY